MSSQLILGSPLLRVLRLQCVGLMLASYSVDWRQAAMPDESNRERQGPENPTGRLLVGRDSWKVVGRFQALDTFDTSTIALPPIFTGCGTLG